MSLLSRLLCVALFVGLALAAGADQAVVKRGQELEKVRKFEEALALYKESLAKAPSVEVCRELGSLLGKLQRYNEAEVILERGLQDFPNQVGLMNLLALIKMRQGEPETARTMWKKVQTLEAGNAFAKEWLAKLDQPDGKLAQPSTGSTAVTGSPSESSGASAAGGLGSSGGSSLSLEEQKKLAKELYEQMVALDKYETKRFVELHREVIERCPQTDQAEESCWRLSNLYLLGESTPDFEGIIEVLEHLLKTYPATPLLPEAKNRLLIAYRQTQRYDKVVELYEELFRQNPQAEDRQFMVWGLEYGEALAAVGRTADAQGLYQQILDRDNNRDSLEARVARQRLEQGN
jgi:tetratricopeptide (TPR) repeat protein